MENLRSAYEPGDTVAIDTGDGSFTKTVRKGFYGQPVIVDGKAYNVTLSADGARLLVESSPVLVGKIRSPQAKWSVNLVGKRYVALASGGPGDEVEVLADQYIVSAYSMWPDARGIAYLRANVDPIRVKYKSVEIAGGQVADLTFGQGLKAIVKPRKNADNIDLSLEFTDLDGYQVTSLYDATGHTPDQPKVKVVDYKGMTVGEVTLEGGMTFQTPWRPRKGLKGTFALKLAYDTKPFVTKLEEGTLKLE